MNDTTNATKKLSPVLRPTSGIADTRQTAHDFESGEGSQLKPGMAVRTGISAGYDSDDEG